MEIVYQIALTMLSLLGVIAAGMAFSQKHRDAAVWIGFAAAVFGVLSFFAWLQAYLWKQDAENTKSTPTRRARVVILDSTLVFPEKPGEPWRVKFTLVNTGEEDAIVSIKDKTLVFDVALSETKFSVQPNPALEFPVQAMPGTGNHAEMRFDVDYTPERREALDTGKARLFIFARGEYRDNTGTVYPLPFARMYDPQMAAGNLVFCPNEITFE